MLTMCNNAVVHTTHFLTGPSCSNSAPSEISSLTTATWPFSAAYISAVLPHCKKDQNNVSFAKDVDVHSGTAISACTEWLTYDIEFSRAQNHNNTNCRFRNYVMISHISDNNAITVTTTVTVINTIIITIINVIVAVITIPTVDHGG